MIRRLRAVGAFCYDFVIGDDWPLSATVVLALGLTVALARAEVAAWWVLPVAVGVVLPVRVWGARRRP